MRSQTRSLPISSKTELMFNNLMKHLLSCSCKFLDNAQDVSGPVRVQPLTLICATEEVGKIQQICEKKRARRSETNWVANRMWAPAQKRQTSDSSQRSIHTVICTKLDKEIDKVAKAQRHISTLVEEFFALKQNTNTLLEAQSAHCRGVQEKVATAENVCVDDTDVTAEVNHCLPRYSFRQIFVKTENKSQIIRSMQRTKSSIKFWNRHSDNSAHSELRDSDLEYVTGDCQIKHIERHYKISLYERKKKTRRNILLVFRLPGTAFDRLVNYRHYRLMDGSYVRLAEESRVLRK